MVEHHADGEQAAVRVWWKPTPPHNPLKAPAACMCIDCCAVIAAKRCTATSPDGNRCGDYKGHGRSHTMLVCTSFLLAEGRLAEASQNARRPEDG
jgi:hypothetical protein